MKNTAFLLIICFTILNVAFTQDNQNQKSNSYSSPIQKFIRSTQEFALKHIGNPSQYIWEALVISLFIICGINYLLGKSLNEKYANAWIQANKPIFDSEFTQVGISNEGDQLLEYESANSFKFFASGRKNCVYAMVILELKKRHDFFSMVIINIFKAQKDRIRIEIPIDTGASLPFLLAIVRRKEAKFVHDNYPDIKNFCRKMTHDELERKYVVLGEDEEVSEFVLTHSVIASLKKYENVIEMISFTDQKKPHKQVLRVDMQIPNTLLKNPQEFQKIIKIILSIADHITTYKMSNQTRVKAEKARKLYEATKEKEIRKEKRENMPKKTQDNKDSGSQKKMQKKLV